MASKIVKASYDKHAENYHKRIGEKSNIWHKHIEKPAMIKFLKSEIKNKSILDLGCGSGVFSQKILSLGAKKVKGIDLSSGLIAIAKREYPKIQFYQGDVTKKTLFKKSEFDVISSSLMVHYIKDLNKLFKEVSRILKKNGIFIFSMHHPVFEVVERLKKDGKKLKTREFKKYFHNNKYIFHIKSDTVLRLVAYHHTFEMIFNALNKNGFVVEDLIETKAPKKAEKLNKKVYKRSNEAPTFLVIKARKIK